MSPLRSPTCLELEAPRWSRDLPRRAGKIGAVLFLSLPPEQELEQIGAFIDRHPHVEVWAHPTYDDSVRDLEFLRHFRSARRVSVYAWSALASLDGLRHLSDELETLDLGSTRRRLSIKGLGRFTALRRLRLDGYRKDIEVLSNLRELRALSLRSVTLPNLEALRPLTQLRSFDLKLGGTTDLRPLGELQQLEYLELWLVRGFSDLSEVSKLSRLKCLFLQALKQVTALPDLSRCARLEDIHLETMGGLTDLRPLRTAPALRDLSMVDMPRLRLEHVEVLRNHPTVERLSIGTGSIKRNAQFAQCHGYPPTGMMSEELRRLARGDIIN